MKLELNTVLSVWWSIFWRSGLYGAAAGFVMGVIFAIIVTLLGHHATEYVGLRVVLGAGSGLLAGIFGLKQALEINLGALIASANRVHAANE